MKVIVREQLIKDSYIFVWMSNTYTNNGIKNIISIAVSFVKYSEFKIAKKLKCTF